MLKLLSAFLFMSLRRMTPCRAALSSCAARAISAPSRPPPQNGEGVEECGHQAEGRRTPWAPMAAARRRSELTARAAAVILEARAVDKLARVVEPGASQGVVPGLTAGGGSLAAVWYHRAHFFLVGGAWRDVSELCRGWLIHPAGDGLPGPSFPLIRCSD